MKITCTGPNGERFEGETSQYRGNPEDVERLGQHERADVYSCLRKWAETVKATAKDAKENP